MLEGSRRKIDAIDREIARLLEQRLSICKELGVFKKDNRIPIEDLAREAEIISNLCDSVDEDTKVLLEKLYPSIFAHAKSLMRSP